MNSKSFNLFRVLLISISLLLSLIIGATSSPLLGAICAVTSMAVWLKPQPQLGTLTLILALLTMKFIKAFRSKVPSLNFISTDLGNDGSTMPAQPVKWNQEVISHLMISPTVSDHTPGEDLESGAQTVTDLASDLYLKIDRAKKVIIKIPASTSVAYVLDGIIDGAVMEAGKALGRAVLSDVFGSLVTPANFSLSLTETVNNADYDTLRNNRIKLNTYGAEEPRFGIGGSQFISNIGADPIVQSGDYHGQQVEADPYQSMVNIEGFQEVREWPNFSADNATLGTFTAVAATNVITVSAAHGLNIGDRVRVSSATTLPAGLAADTDYFVLTVPSTTTLTVSATLGGSVLDITDTGTGVHTIVSYGQLNGFFFERRAIHLAVRQLVDNLENAARLGIPKTIAQHTEVDPETGLAITVFAWLKQSTQDIYLAFTVAYGCKGGRGLAAATGVDPGSLAAGAGMDYAGVRVIES